MNGLMDRLHSHLLQMRIARIRILLPVNFTITFQIYLINNVDIDISHIFFVKYIESSENQEIYS